MSTRLSESKIAHSKICSNAYGSPCCCFLVILVLVQKASDLSSESSSLQQLTHGSGIVEELPLQLCRQGIPLHDQRCPKASKDMLLFHPLLIISEHAEALFEFLKFTSFARRARFVDQLRIFGCFRTVLLGPEHADLFPSKP